MVLDDVGLLVSILLLSLATCFQNSLKVSLLPIICIVFHCIAMYCIFSFIALHCIALYFVLRAPLEGVGEDWVEIVIPHQVII